MMEQIRVGTDDVARNVIDRVVEDLKQAIDGAEWIVQLPDTLRGVVRETVTEAIAPVLESLRRIEVEVGAATDRLSGMHATSSGQVVASLSSEIEIEMLPQRTRDAVQDDLNALHSRLERVEDHLERIDQVGLKLESALHRLEEMTASVLRQQFNRSEVRHGNGPSGSDAQHAEAVP